MSKKCDLKNLYETIPDFHDTKKSYEAFIDAVEKDKKGRVAFCLDDIAFAMKRAKDTELLVNMLAEGELPLRVTHNDTKFNNVMTDDITGEGIALIDLDTVMPGLALYDFGDAISFGVTTALEDEADLSKVNFDINLYEHFTKGYLESAKYTLTKNEIEYLPFSAKLIALELGIRFLTDHLNGDSYFKVNRKNHNLDRSRNQFKLVADMEENMEAMKAIIQKYYVMETV
ncbi:phosphotransferase enzyme family protein [Clostridium gasigenes]|uniref:phosphotransferase enzyme family protein n=1 Tax=Clostridium gasigenes TaxID=94869 RepID=UPI001C0AB8E1|nr:aminoglycoside phosphotransferase family protein [Clostridium gasigenes]MBU3103145.1 aminoglycoside phosphotransferase family protein [Clostridium gasigenes]